MNILVTDNVHEILIKKFEAIGWKVISNYNINYELLKNEIQYYDGLIVRSKLIINKEILDKAKQLKFIGRIGSGMENIDVDYANSKNIKCFNSPEGNRDAVAEHAIALILNLFNNINKAYLEIQHHQWLREENRGIELKDKVVGIIGYGNTGSALAKKLSGFECKIIAYDKYKTGFSNSFVREVSLNEIKKYSDIISFHVPLTRETHYMFDTEFINTCHKNFFLINTSRGPIVKTDDLLNALQQGKVLGAALDVIEYEDTSFEFIHQCPQAFNKLLSMKNVIITPHIAGWTNESKYKLASILADKIISYFRN